MTTWVIRILYCCGLCFGIDLYARPERYERFWCRFSSKRPYTLSRLAGAVLILVSVLFELGMDVFLPG